MEQENHAGLQELRHSDYKIVDDQPDIEGWSIYDGQHQKIGKVHDLLFDPANQQVRYIIAHLKDKIPGNDADQVLVPIGMAELHESDDEVLLPSVTADQLGQFSPYPFDALKNNAADGSAITLGVAGALTTNDQYNDANFYRNRKTTASAAEERLRVDNTRVHTNSILLRSRTIERPSEKSVRLTDEGIEIDRAPDDESAI